MKGKASMSCDVAGNTTYWTNQNTTCDSELSFNVFYYLLLNTSAQQRYIRHLT